ncbi:hypothetical protein ACTXOR_04135 [Arthrobacter rhombi]|uniref:hypothetical protein n=1 Tax=Arthrobacter rhombi TaxID=71253 RepID=UPI003FD1A7A7
MSQRTSGAMAEARIKAIKTGIKTNGTRVAAQMSTTAKRMTSSVWAERILARPKASAHGSAAPWPEPKGP